MGYRVKAEDWEIVTPIAGGNSISIAAGSTPARRQNSKGD